MTLEPVAQTFPELAVIGSHLGYPWVDEMIALTLLYENVYLCTDSYAPQHWPESLDAYVAGPGAGNVMFGTMWPTIPFERAIADIRAKELPSDAIDWLLGGTARTVYGID
ncbi:MAG: amidohydrolase family protein, partial [Acidimicrobiia bacterium]|nr:amidohydrolase family protein [Acidimicrobiia bacterium]